MLGERERKGFRERISAETSGRLALTVPDYGMPHKHSPRRRLDQPGPAKLQNRNRADCLALCPIGISTGPCPLSALP